MATILAKRRMQSRLRWGLIGEQGLLLDIGCGEGTFLHCLWIDWLLGGSFQSIGIDADQQAVKNAAQRGLTDLCARSEKLPLPGHLFDIVTIKHSLEHMVNPPATIQ